MGIAITILVWLMWILLAVFGVLLLLLHLPYQVQLGAQWGESQVNGRAWLGWPRRLLGLLVTISLERGEGTFIFFGIPVKVFSLRDWTKKRKKRKKKKKKPKKKRKQSGLQSSAEILRLPHKGTLLGTIQRAFCLEAKMRGRFGFDDPSATGHLAMFLGLMQSVFPGFGLEIELDYVDPVCEGDLDLSAMIWLPRIYVLAIVFLLSREGRAVMAHRSKPSLA